MNLRLWVFLLLAPAAAFAAAVVSGIEFNGVIVDSAGKTTVSLLNLITGEAKWVPVGSGKFSGYVLTSYVPDAKGADAIVLTRAGSTQTLRVVLKNSVIVASEPAPATLGTPVASSPEARPSKETIKIGDTGAVIAKRAGVKLADLTAANPGIEWTKLQIGQTINLPSPTAPPAVKAP